MAEPYKRNVNAASPIDPKILFQEDFESGTIPFLVGGSLAAPALGIVTGATQTLTKGKALSIGGQNTSGNDEDGLGSMWMTRRTGSLYRLICRVQVPHSDAQFNDFRYRISHYDGSTRKDFTVRIYSNAGASKVVTVLTPSGYITVPEFSSLWRGVDQQWMEFEMDINLDDGIYDRIRFGNVEVTGYSPDSSADASPPSILHQPAFGFGNVATRSANVDYIEFRER